jgi:hypothetical protein
MLQANDNAPHTAITAESAIFRGRLDFALARTLQIAIKRAQHHPDIH